VEASLDGAPGSYLDYLTQVGTISSTPSLVDFTCSSCPVLQAGTLYFLVAQQSSSIESLWHLSVGPHSTIYYNLTDSVFGPWKQAPDAPVGAFSVNGKVSVTPEPSTLTLLGTGLVSLAGVARRRLTLRS